VNFKDSIIPIKNARIENAPMIMPFLKPLYKPKSKNASAIISKAIVYF
jgi:hypothetical protein